MTNSLTLGKEFAPLEGISTLFRKGWAVAQWGDLRRSKRLVLAYAMLGVGFWGGTSSPGVCGSKSSQAADNRVVFLVGGEAVFTQTFENRLRLTALMVGMPLTAEALSHLSSTVARSLIDDILKRQQAQKAGITVDESEITEAIEGIEKGNGMKPGDLAKIFASQGVPLAALQDQIRFQLLWATYIRQFFGSSLSASSQEEEAFLQRRSRMEQETLYDLAEITLYVTDQADEQSVKKQADQIIGWLQQGAPFPAVARQLSQSSSAQEGGRLGLVSALDCDPEIARVLPLLKEGMLSSPIRTTSGYTILAVIGIKPPEASGKPEKLNREQIQRLLQIEHLERISRRELAQLKRRVPVEIRGDFIKP